jgi:crotonobetainyl-CoA:carnitine CoA-transferase CaiB-like acyl-CoA transferase
MVVGIDQKFWPRLCEALGAGDLVDDPKFSRGSPRFVNRDELQSRLGAYFLKRPAAEWAERFAALDHPAQVIRGHEHIADDEQVLANDYVVEREHPVWGREKVVGLHIQLSETPGSVSAPAPELGVHTRAVLSEFGLSEERIDTLLERGVIATG